MTKPIVAGKLSTHVLDTASGKPAAGVRVSVYFDDGHGGPPVMMRSVVTNPDGRSDGPLLDGAKFHAGKYRLDFAVGDYFAERDHPDARRFLDVVTVAFVVDDATAGYHVPLLVSPWAYSTYRGS